MASQSYKLRPRPSDSQLAPSESSSSKDESKNGEQPVPDPAKDTSTENPTEPAKLGAPLSHLIAVAITKSPTGKLCVRDILVFIRNHFPQAPSKVNSLTKTLNRNKWFSKIEANQKCPSNQWFINRKRANEVDDEIRELSAAIRRTRKLKSQRKEKEKKPIDRVTVTNIPKTGFSLPHFIRLALKNSPNEGLVRRDIKSFIGKHFPGLKISGDTVSIILNNRKWFKKAEMSEKQQTTSFKWTISREMAMEIDEQIEQRAKDCGDVIRELMEKPDDLHALIRGDFKDEFKENDPQILTSSVLIEEALKSSPTGSLSSREIGRFVAEKYPDFIKRTPSFKNNLTRHLDKCKICIKQKTKWTLVTREDSQRKDDDSNHKKTRASNRRKKDDSIQDKERDSKERKKDDSKQGETEEVSRKRKKDDSPKEDDSKKKKKLDSILREKVKSNETKTKESDQGKEHDSIKNKERDSMPTKESNSTQRNKIDSNHRKKEDSEKRSKNYSIQRKDDDQREKVYNEGFGEELHTEISLPTTIEEQVASNRSPKTPQNDKLCTKRSSIAAETIASNNILEEWFWTLDPEMIESLNSNLQLFSRENKKSICSSMRCPENFAALLRGELKNGGGCVDKETLDLPLRHFENPPYKHTHLLTLALINCHQLRIHEVYEFISQHFPYFETCEKYWKDGILWSLNNTDCFVQIKGEDPVEDPTDLRLDDFLDDLTDEEI